MKTTLTKYRVVVSNVGTVYRGCNAGDARIEYDDCVRASKDGVGRYMGEEVTLFEDDEILAEHHPAPSVEAEAEAEGKDKPDPPYMRRVYNGWRNP